MPLPDPLAPPPSLAGAPWLAAAATQAVFAALRRHGHAARAVGGSVRNALLGTPVKDIDIATTARPDEIIAAAGAAGLAAHPTGIDHGTITIVSDHVPFEVTTLRRDVETFGRHAVVSFTNDWADDAARRDFTINALYCDARGEIHDPLGGWPDLLARRVRFIGDAHARIREDYLRILRFFRFFAEYADGEPDAVGVAACVAEREGLRQLSGERIHMELLRLLAAPRAVDAVRIMAAGGILERLEPHPDVARLERLAAIEAALGRAPDPLLRLAALTIETVDDARHVREHLRLSNLEGDTLHALATPSAVPDPFAPATDERLARATLYRSGPRLYVLRGLLEWADSATPPDDTARRTRLELPSRWTAPALPIAGRDVLTLGVPSGPRVGRIMKTFEDWWIGADFPSDPAIIASALQREIAATEP